MINYVKLWINAEIQLLKSFKISANVYPDWLKLKMNLFTVHHSFATDV